MKKQRRINSVNAGKIFKKYLKKKAAAASNNNILKTHLEKNHLHSIYNYLLDI